MKKRYKITSTAFPHGIHWHGENEDEVFKATNQAAKKYGLANNNVLIELAPEEHEKDATIAAQAARIQALEAALDEINELLTGTLPVTRKVKEIIRAALKHEG